MNLILQAIKSLLRGLENRISANVATLSAKVTNIRTTANAANKTATKALTKANHAQDTAEDALSKANNAQTTAEKAKTEAAKANNTLNSRQLLDYSSNTTYDLAPTKTTVLTAGEQSNITTAAFASYKNLITLRPIGHQLNVGCRIAYSNNTFIKLSVLLTKTDSRTYEGGVWQTFKVDTPQYYHLLLREDSTNSYYIRYL